MGKRAAGSQDDSEDSVESWTDKDTRVLVTQPEGFMCQVSPFAPSALRAPCHTFKGRVAMMLVLPCAGRAKWSPQSGADAAVPGGAR